ncbi:MAG: hypothetical protein JNM22_05025 [Saprospiraceae bacterium]|nr:hypothetical protein [Saprospiraceae bacterium]
MNWVKIIRNALITSVMAFVISSMIMVFLNTRVNWSQQGSTALLFFLGAIVILFFQERKNNKPASAQQPAPPPETPENHE